MKKKSVYLIFFGWQEIPNWFPACFQVAALLPCTLSLRHLHVAKISSWKKSGNLWELLNLLDLGIQLIEALLASFQTHQTCITVSPFMSCRLYLSISAFPKSVQSVHVEMLCPNASP